MDNIRWNDAWFEALESSASRISGAGPVGMAVESLGALSSGISDLMVPWRSPRAAASLAAGVAGGIVTVNMARQAVDAATDISEGYYGGAIGAAAIGGLWYMGGRYTLGAMSNLLYVKGAAEGALADYEKAAEEQFRARNPEAHARLLKRLNSQRKQAEATDAAAKVAESKSTGPAAQASAEAAAMKASEVIEAGKRAADATSSGPVQRPNPFKRVTSAARRFLSATHRITGGSPVSPAPMGNPTQVALTMAMRPMWDEMAVGNLTLAELSSGQILDDLGSRRSRRSSRVAAANVSQQVAGTTVMSPAAQGVANAGAQMSADMIGASRASRKRASRKRDSRRAVLRATATAPRRGLSAAMERAAHRMASMVAGLHIRGRVF